MAVLRLVPLVLACAAAAPAVGVELYRCVSPGGTVSYQDAPCADGSQLTRTIPVLVDPVHENVPSKPGSKAPKSRAAAGSKPGAGKSGATDPRGKQRVACDQARKQRDAALDRMGLNRTFEKLQALDAAVQEACKGL